jgi:hypothetical protein
MADRPMTDHERNEWLVAKRLEDGNLHPQTRAIDAYELIRTRARRRRARRRTDPGRHQLHPRRPPPARRRTLIQ